MISLNKVNTSIIQSANTSADIIYTVIYESKRGWEGWVLSDACIRAMKLNWTNTRHIASLGPFNLAVTINICHGSKALKLVTSLFK